MGPPPNQTYKTFILAGERFTLGDSVMVRQETDDGTSDFIGKLQKIHTDKHSEVQLDLVWYYRPEETKLGRKPWHAKSEILESDHKDTVHVGCVNSKCKVYTLSEYEGLEPGSKKPTVGKKNEKSYVLPEFISRSFYMHKKGVLKEALPTYCVCNTPSNPDKMLIACDTCDKWFHAECMKVKSESVAKRKTFYCCKKCESKAGKSAKKSRTK